VIALVVGSNRSQEIIGHDNLMIADQSITGCNEQQDKHPEKNDQPFHVIMDAIKLRSSSCPKANAD
jgi:hypothetical protein